MSREEAPKAPERRGVNSRHFGRRGIEGEIGGKKLSLPPRAAAPRPHAEKRVLLDWPFRGRLPAIRPFLKWHTRLSPTTSKRCGARKLSRRFVSGRHIGEIGNRDSAATPGRVRPAFQLPGDRTMYPPKVRSLQALSYSSFLHLECCLELCHPASSPCATFEPSAAAQATRLSSRFE